MKLGRAEEGDVEVDRRGAVERIVRESANECAAALEPDGVGGGGGQLGGGRMFVTR